LHCFKSTHNFARILPSYPPTLSINTSYSFFCRFWRVNLIYLPILEDKSTLDIRYLNIVSELSKILVPATSLLTLWYLFMGLYGKFFLGGIVTFCFSLPLILIYYKHFWAAKTSFFAQFIFISLFLPFGVGSDACTEWIIILTPALAYLLFDKSGSFIYFAIGLVCYVTIKLTYQYHEPWLVTNYPEVYRFFLAAVISSFLFWLMVLFRRESMKSEAIIKEQHASLFASKAEIESSNESLLALNRELKQFTHMASHDMKEPLRTIMSFSALLARRMNDNPENKEFLFYIEDGAKRMTRMLDDLISYANAGMEKSPAESVDLNQILNSVCKNLAFQLVEVNGGVESCNLPTVSGHATLLAQLFQNLISNGLKYRRIGIEPSIKVRALKKDGDLLLVFRDNGIGIEKEYLTKIFEPFRRLHTRTEFEGSGIGLATCRKIVDLYGGMIWVDSIYGESTSVMVQLPSHMILETWNAEIVNSPIEDFALTS
jgi:signal transduction histidine kinase